MIGPHSLALALAALAALALAPLPATAGDTLTGEIIATDAGDLVVHPVNHATLVLGLGSHMLYFDPAKADFSGLPAPTAIFVTHAHGDHFDPAYLAKIAGSAPIVVTAEVMARLPEALRSQATVLANGDTATVDGIEVRAVPAYNITPGHLSYHPRGVGNGYVLTLGGKHVYVAGDTEGTAEMRALTGIDVAFLPVNQPYTMTVDQAADAVRAFRPAIVYPFHYQGTDLAPLAGLVGDASEVRLRDWYAGG